VHRAIFLVHNEGIAISAVIHYAVACFHSGQGQDVCYPFWMEPYWAISWQVSYQVCAGHSCSAVYIHAVLLLMYVLDKPWVTEYIHGGLAVKQHPP